MEITKVYRSGDVPEKIQKFPLCDAYAPKIWAKQTYFYRLTKGQSMDRIRHVICEGLSRLSTDYPRMCSAVRRGPSGDPRDCYADLNDGHGVVMYQDLTSRSDVPTYEELLKTNVAIPLELGFLLVPHIGFRPVKNGDIMIAVKISKLQGAFCLGVAYNHSLGDGGNLVDIERTWGSHCADVSAGRKGKKYFTPIHDPQIISRLSTPIPGVPELDDENFAIFPAAVSQLNLPDEVLSEEEVLDNMREAKKEAVEEGDDIRWAIWHFTADAVRQLRKDASSPDAPQPVSEVSALAGLFWSRVCAAKKVSEDGEEQSKLFFPINIRHRLKPQIPLSFVGNIDDIVDARCSLAELEKDDPSSIRAAAYALRHAIGNWSQARVEQWITTAAKLPPDQALCPNPLKALAAQNLIFNDYSRAPTQFTDWGSDIGRVDRVRYPRPAAGPATAVRVHPRLPDGSLEVAASGPDEVLMAVNKDPLFRKYATLACYPA